MPENKKRKQTNKIERKIEKGNSMRAQLYFESIENATEFRLFTAVRPIINRIEMVCCVATFSACLCCTKNATIFSIRCAGFICRPYRLYLETRNRICCCCFFFKSRNKLLSGWAQDFFFYLAIRKGMLNTSFACFSSVYRQNANNGDRFVRAALVQQYHAIIALWPYIKISCTLFCVPNANTEQHWMCMCVCTARMHREWDCG